MEEEKLNWSSGRNKVRTTACPG